MPSASNIFMFFPFCRLKLAMKDGEIQRLQACLQERQANDQTDLIENLRTDLQNMIEKNQRSMYTD